MSNKAAARLCARFTEILDELAAAWDRPTDPDAWRAIYGGPWSGGQLTDEGRAALVRRRQEQGAADTALLLEGKTIAPQLFNVAVGLGMTATEAGALLAWDARGTSDYATKPARAVVLYIAAKLKSAPAESLTVTEAAKLTGLRITTISKACKGNPPKLKSTGTGRDRRITAKDLSEFVDARTDNFAANYKREHANKKRGGPPRPPPRLPI